jgi:hypothetical protein
MSSCSAPHDVSKPSLLGKLYHKPTARCSCGSKVYELRGAYLRRYIKPNDDSFVWHEPPAGKSGVEQTLTEIHLLVEHTRDQVGKANRLWLHLKATGASLTIVPLQLVSGEATSPRPPTSKSPARDRVRGA